MELNTTDIMSIAISVMVVIITIIAVVMSLGEPSYASPDTVMWLFHQ